MTTKFFLDQLPYRMAPISCPVANCTQTFPDNIDATVLLRLLDLHARTDHAAAAAPQVTQPHIKPEAVKRPTVSASGTEEEWQYFIQRWTTYKQATQLTGDHIIFQLLETCEESLRRDLTRTHGDLTNQPEATVMQHIKSLAVRLENPMVARFQLQQLRQDRDEPIRAFAARLKGQASVCKFLKQCSCAEPREVDYTSDMVRDCLIRGLEDEDIRLEILGQHNQDMTLDQVIQIADAKESGKRSAHMLHEGAPVTPIAAAVSTYRKQSATRPQHQNKQRDAPPSTTLRCGNCGNQGHSSLKDQRRVHCPAWKHRCTICRIPNHFESVCRRRQRRNTTTDENSLLYEATAVFDTLCTVEDK